jgi:hypothetical protein
MLLLVETGLVVSEHLIQTGLLPMQLILLPAAEIGTTITLTWNAPDPDGAGPCSSSSDAMNITVNSPMVANAGTDQNICGTSSVTLAANVVIGGTWTGGTGTFNPNRNTANALTHLLPEKWNYRYTHMECS